MGEEKHDGLAVPGHIILAHELPFTIGVLRVDPPTRQVERMVARRRSSRGSCRSSSRWAARRAASSLATSSSTGAGKAASSARMRSTGRSRYCAKSRRISAAGPSASRRSRRSVTALCKDQLTLNRRKPATQKLRDRSIGGMSLQLLARPSQEQACSARSGSSRGATGRTPRPSNWSTWGTLPSGRAGPTRPGRPSPTSSGLYGSIRNMAPPGARLLYPIPIASTASAKPSWTACPDGSGPPLRERWNSIRITPTPSWPLRAYGPIPQLVAA